MSKYQFQKGSCQFAISNVIQMAPHQNDFLPPCPCPALENTFGKNEAPKFALFASLL